MTKRWDLWTNAPLFGRNGGFTLIKISADWSVNWVTASVVVLGFGLTVTRWIDPDVYGDGGVA